MVYMGRLTLEEADKLGIPRESFVISTPSQKQLEVLRRNAKKQDSDNRPVSDKPVKNKPED